MQLDRSTRRESETVADLNRLGCSRDPAQPNVRFSNRALMSSSQFLWHCIGRVLAWVKLLFAVGTGGIQPLQASVGRCGEPGLWTCFYAQQTYTASSRPRPRRDAPFGVGVSGYFMTLLPPYPSGTGCHRATYGGG